MCGFVFVSWKKAQRKPLDIQVTGYVIYWCENPLARCKQIPSSKLSSPKQRGDSWGGIRGNVYQVAVHYRSVLNYSTSATVIQFHSDWMWPRRRNLEGVLTVTGSAPVQRRFPDVHLHPLFIQSLRMPPFLLLSSLLSFLFPSSVSSVVHPALTPTLRYKNINLYSAVWTTVPSLSPGGQLSFITRAEQRCLPTTPIHLSLS